MSRSPAPFSVSALLLAASIVSAPQEDFSRQT
jgi:hypothetical protein